MAKILPKLLKIITLTVHQGQSFSTFLYALNII